MTIQRVIDENVRGPVQCLPKPDVLELRVKLREAYPFEVTTGWTYHVWCEEIRLALGYPNNRKPRVRKSTKVFTNDNVMPAMRAWAKGHGLIAEPGAEAEAEKVIITVRQVGCKTTWEEHSDADSLTDPNDIGSRNPGRVSVKTLAQAKRWASAIVEAFNRTRKENELARELVSVRFAPRVSHPSS